MFREGRDVIATGPRLGLRLWVATGAMALVLLGLAPSHALGARTFDSVLPPFSSTPSSVSFAENGDVWVTGEISNPPPSSRGIYRFDPYPSQTRLAAPATGPLSASLWIQAAADHSSGELFVAQSNAREVVIFGSDEKYSRSWTSINGHSSYSGIHVAVDNSSKPSRGTIYLSLGSPEDDIEAVDRDQRPVDFAAAATYIEGNKITGTPAGDFGHVDHVSTDRDGNIYVTDDNRNTVEEFRWTGEYVHTFPAPRAEYSEGAPGFGGAAVDPTNGDVLIAQGMYDGSEGGIVEYDASGNFLGRIVTTTGGSKSFQGTPAVDSTGRLYAPDGANSVAIFEPAPVRPEVEYGQVSPVSATSGTLRATVDPNGGGPITECHFEYGSASGNYGLGEEPCSPNPASSPPSSNFSTPTEVSVPLSGLTTEQTYHYRVVVKSAGAVKYGIDQTYTPHEVVGLRTEPATEIAETTATLNASLVGDGTPTDYLFEWGRTTDYGNVSATPPGEPIGSPAGPGRSPLSLALGSLEPFATYHFRVVSTSENGTSYGEDQEFTTPPGVPTIRSEHVTEVHSDRAVLHGEVRPNGAPTNYHFEYVADESFQQNGFKDAVSTDLSDVGRSKRFQPAEVSLDGLDPGTHYHYRVVGTNSAGTAVSGMERTFQTYPFGFEDKCPNAHVRQQTGSALLLDCRAYELASATSTGGYDVESDMAPGQKPFPEYPYASGPSKLLYGVHGGGIPGAGATTNHGVDPYVATRSPSGWMTRYVGIPADNPFSDGPFASTLTEADASLETFAFGGSSICSPCFADGTTGQPVRLRNGALVQGMAGPSPLDPAAAEAGYVAKRFSADGSRFVFGSTTKFTPDGNSDGSVTIYSRDLENETTEAVSKTPGGATMTGPGIGELDISSDGSRVVFGQVTDTDPSGNKYWHLYMTVGDAGHSIDLMEGATDGALYAGMAADGKSVYFSTRDALTPDDSDTSADIYRADVSGSQAELTRVSTGSEGTGDTDDCEPFANTVHARWNSLDPDPNCDVLAIGGGGGVASENGTIYFLSPESLDRADPKNQPVDGAPNLYVAEIGSPPRFIRTLESSANAAVPLPSHQFVRSFGTFTKPIGVAIDRSNGDVYVHDLGSGEGADASVKKYDSAGSPVLDFASNGKLNAPSLSSSWDVPTTIAVDNDPSSPNYRNVFVPTLYTADNFGGGFVKSFDSDGNFDFSLDVTWPSGVSVDPANGNIYVTSYLNSTVNVFSPDGTPLKVFPTISFPTAIAAVNGKVYVVDGGGLFNGPGVVRAYDASGADLGQFDAGPAKGVSVNPLDQHVYVDRGNRVSEFNPAGEPVGQPVGTGLLGDSVNTAAMDGVVLATDRASQKALTFGPLGIPPNPKVDSPVVVHSLGSSAERHPGDFQVTPSGKYAVFPSTLPLTGYENVDHLEVYRYNAQSGTADCSSCKPTGEQAAGDASLPPNGLGLTNDGRVFFNSTEALVDRDLNQKKDAYEWKPGEGIELISTGAAALGASLLGVTADGTDAYFFTREKLAAEDENGSRVKIYDARAFGGFPYSPPPIPCKASDECHGAGSPTPAAPSIGTIAGRPIGNAARRPAKCKARKKKCARKKHSKQRKGRKGGQRRG
jgi:hypothetical protein